MATTAAAFFLKGPRIVTRIIGVCTVANAKAADERRV